MAKLEGYPAYGGRASRGSRGEIIRLSLASAISGGTLFRSKVLSEAQNSWRAPPLEIGLDKIRLVKLCYDLERNEQIYAAAILLFVVALGAEWYWNNAELIALTIPAALLVMAVIGGIRRIRDIIQLQEFKNQSFDLEALDARLAKIKLKDELRCVGDVGQNVVVYEGFFPFDFAGVPLGGWAFAVDIHKPAAAQSIDLAKLKSITLRSIEETIKAGISMHLPGIVVRSDILVVSGLDSDILPLQLTEGNIFAPTVSLSQDVLEAITEEYPGVARRYLWFSVDDWGGEITISVFLRIRLNGRILFIENSKFILGPISERYRKVDRVPADSNISYFAEFCKGVLLSAFSTVALFIGARPTRVSEVLESFRKLPFVDRGATTSVRRSIMATEFLHFYQRSDVDCFVKSFEILAIETLATYLSEFGIDVSDLRNKEITIFNAGILVQGGDVTAQTLAVGPMAKAGTTFRTFEPAKSS